MSIRKRHLSEAETRSHGPRTRQYYDGQQREEERGFEIANSREAKPHDDEGRQNGISDGGVNFSRAGSVTGGRW